MRPAASPVFAIDARTLREWTAPRLLVERARATPDAVALRSKDLGLYRERSFTQLAAMVARCAAALRSLGVRKGDRVAIMGDPCEEWIVVDLAAQAAGAIVYGIYPTASQAELEYQMRDGGACLFVAENQEYVDKILPIAQRLPALRRIHAAIVVARDAQRPIVIGARGERIKRIATEARLDLERLFGTKVFLELFVKVKSGWAGSEQSLRSYGYE